MSSWVLLRHDLPDGSWHRDWMLDDAAARNDCVGGERVEGGLLSFRVEGSVVWPPEGGFECVRIDRHRREYLKYEGPVSGGRGEVVREAGGDCTVVWSGTEALRILMTCEEWTGGVAVVVRLVGRGVGNGGHSQEMRGASEVLWRFDLESR